MTSDLTASPRGPVLDVLRALGAVLILVALLFVLPWVLVQFVGWPLPRQLPSWDELRRALAGSSISDVVLIKALAVVCWVAWAQLSASVLVEGVAWARGRVAGRVPLSGLVQPLARRLVVSSTLLFGVLRPQTPMMPIANLPVVELAFTAPALVEEPLSEAPPEGSAATEPASVTCVVRPRDSLWKLAEDHLGDGLRWREVWEMNRGREFADGGVLHDPDLIQPGWILNLPSGATLTEPSPSLVPEEAAAPDQPAAATRQPVAVAPSDAASTGKAPSRSIAPPGSADTVPSVPGKAEPPASKDDRDGISVPENVGPLVGSVLAVGLVAYLGRHRLAQQRRRAPGRTIPMPTENLASAEAELRREANAGIEGASRLDFALRALAWSLAAARQTPLPSVDAVSLTDDQVEVLFSSPLRAPSGPFDVGAGGRAWTLPSTVSDENLISAGAGQAVPMPALAEVGRIGDRQVFVDLEVPSITSIVGAIDETSSLLWAMAFELATNTRADDLRLIVVGEPPPGLKALDRVEAVASLEGVYDGLHGEADANRVALSEAGFDSTMEARCRQPADPWTPTVVIVAEPETVDEERIFKITQARTGVAVVVDQEEPLDGCGRHLVVKGQSVVVTPPGLTLKAGGLGADLVSAAGELLEVATEDGPGEELLQEEHDRNIGDGGGGNVVPLALRLPSPEFGEDPVVDRLLVKVLGSVDFVGSKAPLDRPQSRELVVYLALHPEGVDEGRLKAALWRDASPQGGAFNEAVSRARRCLGTATDGSHRLPHVREGLYRLSDTSVTDFHLLECAYRRARISASEETVGALAEVLALVRGLPFEGSRGYEWAYAEGFVSRMEALVAEAAALVAEWSLECDDYEVAVWATRQGVKAALADERLFQIRMRAQGAAGDFTGLEATVDELCAVLEIADPAAGVLTETMTLYESLRKPKRRVGNR